MMLCTRLYVEPTEALLGQARKKNLLSILKQQREDTRGHNDSFITITSKDNKQASRKAENKQSKRKETGSEGNLSTVNVIM